MINYFYYLIKNLIRFLIPYKNNKYNNCKGLFEIHISVEPSQIINLKLFCLENSIKPILAVTHVGDNPNQLMISKFVKGNGCDAIIEANDIKKRMIKSGIIVKRVKVEAMISNKGVPQLPFTNKENSNYFEYHIKIPIKTIEEYNKVHSFCQLNEYSISFSAFKETISILLTLRISPSKGINYVKSKLDECIIKLKDNNINFEESIQKEFSIYDDNIDYDYNWLKIIY
jgi:hypothetical protein